ncbi:MAG TPA: hypothetical protein VNC12_05045 [Solirubrobacteraceae bacterium]|nr:hypothetical protein [Solirubrobacteraceae bacterium]
MRPRLEAPAALLGAGHAHALVGTRYAIASWDGLSAEGRWLWRVKDRIERGWIARFNG